MRPRRLVTIAAAVAIVAGVALFGRPYARGASFVARAAGMHGAVRALANLGTRAASERMVDVGVNGGSTTIRARLYWPTGGPRRVTLLITGLHPAGIDEPRLVDLARQLAVSGVAVLTPSIPELSTFEITTNITREIHDAAIWLSSMPEVKNAGGRIGLIGISFSGGLSVVAAGMPSLRDHVAYVLSLGGHDDLPRVLRYLCTGVESYPEGQRRLRFGKADTAQMPTVPRPHDYGVAVILLGVADRLVPAAQVASLRHAVRRFLDASSLERVDKAHADQEFAALKSLAPSLPEPSATLLRYVNERDVVRLGSRLLPYLGEYGGAPELSPSKSPKPTAPLFLLHGRDDNVIPAVESEILAEEVSGRTPVRLLVSDLISHAEVQRSPGALEVMQLAGFWGELLGY